MKIIKFVFLMLTVFLCIVGCSGRYGKVKTQSESDAKATEKELLNNWTEYNVYMNRSYLVVRLKGPHEAGAIVFDPKNDDRKILVGRYWDKVEDQKSWTEIVKANTTGAGNFYISPLGTTDNTFTTGVREIWGPDNQLYGFIIARVGHEVVVSKVDEKSIRLAWNPGVSRDGAP
jgi:hypothetical protein